MAATQPQQPKPPSPQLMDEHHPPFLRHSSLTLDLALGQTASGMDLPPIAALFLIRFDIKAGYLIEWKRTATGVNIDGVEYKSLPSGLHKLSEDLVYFVHQPFAGVAAFINAPAGEENRNSNMLSVGVLVPLAYGRLGRSWRHAQNLKELAVSLAKNPSDHEPLKNYFTLYHASDELMEQHMNNKNTIPHSPGIPRSVSFQQVKSQPRMHLRHRSISDATALLVPGQTLSPHHPALSLPDFVLAFGPLIFPLHRAALMRKRILLVAEAPVEKACNFVYDISVLSNIPFAVADLITPELPRLKPLFSIGVHDIPTLELEAAQIKNRASGLPYTTNGSDLNNAGELGSWVAATTDSILAMKKDLYDILVKLPPPESENAKEKVWPTIELSSTGEQLKATQRDLRRYRALKRSLSRYASHPTENPFYDDVPDTHDDDDMGSSIHEYDENDELVQPILERRTSTISTRSIPQFKDIDSNSDLEETVCEKLSWPQLAYESFIWWASAGEQRIDIGDGDSEGLEARPGSEDEATGYSTLATPGGQKPVFLAHQRRRSTGLSISGMDGTGPLGNAEMDIIAYFHRMTSRIVGGMADIIEASGLSEGEGEAAPPDTEGFAYRGDIEPSPDDDRWVFISPDDMLRLGLDQWSTNDEKFLREVTRLWFKRDAMVERSGFQICGVKLC
ncbi:hypothetical protein AOL_s00097g468 [Orbilia oligospora ATCC 24927]|uniref:DUF4484 domain-containing protein n=3 Tax=Orbilia oligospora TaxID=2813651 RepID=G1XJE1_ARTOA|nr:hypothetical protein AOL_s00097g468 [Orbilia oligospora ATCC 24927]EGX46720.1 hypothetical protein AOL_s00097g468 [Orbilia oligospora ATCC 24927]KAF3273602.1 hypothetical protein TWF970_008967 [Orbilia oligospora]